MNLSRGKQPPQRAGYSWHYEVAPGVVMTAVNEEGLTKQIFEYRMRHNIPIGDIERDIDRYYCERWPSCCHKEDADWSPGGDGPASPPSEPFVNRVARWASLLLHRLPRGGFQLVPDSEATRRGTICAGCPKNQPWRVGCKGCSNATATLLAQLRNLKSSKSHASLYGCQIGGWDNATAVWMDVQQLELTDAQKAGLPDRCWRKQL